MQNDKKPFVVPTLTEESSLVAVTLVTINT
jgi:hydroxymethylglutaryl-CoA reductase